MEKESNRFTLRFPFEIRVFECDFFSPLHHFFPLFNSTFERRTENFYANNLMCWTFHFILFSISCLCCLAQIQISLCRPKICDAFNAELNESMTNLVKITNAQLTSNWKPNYERITATEKIAKEKRRRKLLSLFFVYLINFKSAENQRRFNSTNNRKE